MRYNKTNMPVEVFLNRAHARAKIKYIERLKDEDKTQAQQLQDFFRALKDVAAGKDIKKNNIFDQAIIQQILDTTNQLLSSRGFNTRDKVTKLFRRSSTSYKQGMYFEKELEAVFQAVLIKALGEDVNLGSYEISTGQKTGTTTITKDLEEKIKEGLAKGLSEEEIFQKEHNKLYLKRVQIKTDIQGVNINIQAIENEEIRNIQKLLNNVTISAKSYRTHSYNQEEEI